MTKKTIQTNNNPLRIGRGKCQYYNCEIHGEFDSIGLLIQMRSNSAHYEFCFDCIAELLLKHIPQMIKGELKEVKQDDKK